MRAETPHFGSHPGGGSLCRIKYPRSKPRDRTMSIVHQYKGIDPIDSILSPAFVASTLTTTGIATISLLGFGFADPLIEASGASLTVGWVVGAVALLGAFATNQTNFRGLDDTELAVVGGMLVVHVGVALIPLVRDFVTSSEVVAIPVVMLQAAGYYLIAYY